MSLTDYSQGCRLFSFIYISHVFDRSCFLILIKSKKHRQSSDYQCFFSSRGDWIRTSDHTPPRRVL